jgi:MFS family permease
MALGWLVYNVITQDSVKLALVSFAGQIPTLLFGIFVGALVDRYDRRLLIILAQLAFLLQGIALVALTLGLPFGVPPPLSTYPVILGLSFVGGVAMCLDQSARVAFVGELVPPQDLSNAVALSSLAFNGARILGPVLAGFVMAESSRRFPAHPAIGEGLCFAFNALTNVAVLVAMIRLGRMSNLLQPAEPRDVKIPVDRSLGGGLRYVRARPHLLALLLFNAVMAVVAIPYLVLMPVYARDGLNGDATVLSHLMASIGLGAILGGTVMASRPNIRGLSTHIGLSGLGFAVCVALAAVARGHLMPCLIMGFAGFFMVMAMIGANTLSQTLTSRHIRGRVLTLFNMASVGMIPIGSLAMGAVAKYTNIRTALLVCAVGTTLALLGFAWRLPQLRRHARETQEYKLALGIEEVISPR